MLKMKVLSCLVQTTTTTSVFDAMPALSLHCLPAAGPGEKACHLLSMYVLHVRIMPSFDKICLGSWPHVRFMQGFMPNFRYYLCRRAAPSLFRLVWLPAQNMTVWKRTALRVNAPLQRKPRKFGRCDQRWVPVYNITHMH